jgi:membrane associated rhomboid family serine protease
VIPLRDTVRARSFPVINTLIIVANVLIFLFETSMSDQSLQRFIFAFGLIPARFWQWNGPVEWMTVFTSMFLHGGWAHLLSNMLALYIFGDNVEDRVGHGRYLIFYLLGGTVAAVTHAFSNPASPIPTVGASGAIAAVLGAYILLYPRARVITLILLPIFILFPIIEIPAILYLGIWFVSQVLNGAFALTNATFQEGGVAWWAHIGGFVYGLLLIKLFTLGRQSPKRRDFYPDQYSPW